MENTNERHSWDLSLFYKNKKEFDKKVKELKSLTKEVSSFKGKIYESCDSLYNFLKKSQELDLVVEDLYVYVHLKYSLDTSSSEYIEEKQKIEKLCDDISEEHSFINSELLSKDYEELKKMIRNDERLKPYEYMFFCKYRYKNHILGEEKEELLAKLTSAYGNNDNAFEALDYADIDLGYIKDSEGKKIELTLATYIRYVGDSKRSVRKSAFESMHKFYKSHINTLSALYSGTVKESSIISEVRKFEDPLQKSLYSDNVTKKLYDTLIKVTRKNVPSLSRYYEIKRKALRLKDFHIYDSHVNIIDENKVNIEYEESIKILNEAFKPLGDNYLNALNSYINNRHVDVYPRKGKRSGAFQWGSYLNPSYVFLNYNNTRDSVMTFAHEMGHAMHSHFSKEKQMYEYAGYPIFLAEVASTVNEQLLVSYLLKTAKTDEEKKAILCDFIDKVKGTIYRQVMFADFEKQAFEKYKADSSLTKDFLCDLHYNLNKEYYGKNVVIDELTKYEWARIPHFYNPFYVYKYATGLISAMIISDKILNEKGFAQKYIDKFLSSGCSKFPLDILKDIGVNLEDEKVLQSGFNVFEDKVKALECLINKK